MFALEERWRPRERGYILFLGEFPTSRFVYCLKGKCKRPTEKSLSSILTEALDISGTTRREILDKFSERYWLLDLFESKEEVGGLRRITDEEIARRLDALKKRVMRMMGTFPETLLPALKHNPSRKQSARGQSFGARVFRALQNDPDLSGSFRPIYFRPWRDREEYVREVRASFGINQ